MYYVLGNALWACNKELILTFGWLFTVFLKFNINFKCTGSKHLVIKENGSISKFILIAFFFQKMEYFFFLVRSFLSLAFQFTIPSSIYPSSHPPQDVKDHCCRYTSLNSIELKTNDKISINK